MGNRKVDTVGDAEYGDAGGDPWKPSGNGGSGGLLRGGTQGVLASVACAAEITGPEQTDDGWLLVTLHNAAVK